MPEDAHKLRRLLELSAHVDALLEAALQRRLSLAEAVAVVLPHVCEATGARAAFIRSYNEDLALETYRWPPNAELPAREEVLARTGPDHREEFAAEFGDDVVIARALDVAGEWFGSAALVVARSAAGASEREHLAECLRVAAEELDNFLFAIRAAREKHRVMMELSAALRHRVLGNGLREAVKVLANAIPLERLLLVCVAEEDHAPTTHVQLFERGELKLDTMGGLPHEADEAEIRAEARAHLRERDAAFLRRFRFENAQEEVLINGITHASIVGKVFVSSSVGAFNTYDRELLAGFAGFVRQRVVDFSKEWRTLARSFGPEAVAELLHFDDYAQRFLAPHEETVAILYSDISGFTKLSEQVLKSPSAVAKLVEDWSRDVVELVWAHGGVFDKMVGDCVIALFGPPFYKQSPGERLDAAVRCARAIRDATAALPDRPGFEPIRDNGGLAVSTGVNLAPLFVGRFGPNDNFTGFSSGMNNTARLQACAGRGEILVMADAIEQLAKGHRFAFGEERSAKVKNVAEPLRFRALA